MQIRPWPLLTLVLTLLAIYALWGLAQGVPSSMLALLMVLFLGVQTWKLHQAAEAGPAALELYPLFRGAGATSGGGGAGAGQGAVL